MWVQNKSAGNASMKKCLRVIAELQRNVDQTLMGVESRKHKHKRKKESLEKDIFVSNNGRVKENKANAKKCHREKAEKNCEGVFFTIGQPSYYTPYSKMATIIMFFCFPSNYPLLLRC